METIKEIECTIGRENDEPPSTDTLTKHIVKSHNQPGSVCGIGKTKCFIPNPITPNCNSVSHKKYSKKIIKAKKLFWKFKFTMLLQYSRECLGFIALILTTYATLLNKEPVIGGTKSPKPIFFSDSIVQEWPYGNLVDVQSKVAASELSLIYFYAPWCAESLLAKKVYTSVANVYSGEVYFAAVNCWQPNSGCRTLYNNVYKWPVLMAYLPNALSVQYKGNWNYRSLSTFIDGLLIPIVRIFNKQELIQLRIANDGVILGLFNSCYTKEFQIFFKTAIKWLENNHYETTKFAVFVGEHTSMFLDSEAITTPVIKLFTPYDTIIFRNTKWTIQNIIYFLKQQLTDSSIWVNLPNAKSSIMYKYFQQGPVLMMFTPLVSQSQPYFIMKQIFYEYNRYQIDLNSSVLNEFVSEYPVVSKKHSCDFPKKFHHQSIKTQFVGVNHWNEVVQTCNASNKLSYIFPQLIPINKNNAQRCEEELYQCACPQRIIDKLDSRSPSEVLKRYKLKQCLNMKKLPKQWKNGVFESVDSTIKLLNLEHKNNRTLKFLMLDSMVHYEYIRNFIGDFKLEEISSFSQSQVLIIDNDREMVHLEKRSISTKNALKLVSEFHSGKLNRHLRSSKRNEIKNNSSNNLMIQIKEINSLQFSKIKKRSNITSVVLIYTPQCFLCNVMAQALLHISYIINLRNVKFYRINASANEVCWEYTMDTYPTLIVFSKNRSSDTNVFSLSLPISVKNVFSFILSNLNLEQQSNSIINACKLSKLKFAFQNCVSRVSAMINVEISHQLQRINQAASNKTDALTRLKELKGIDLELLRVRNSTDLFFISKEIFKSTSENPTKATKNNSFNEAEYVKPRKTFNHNTITCKIYCK
ncbi:uncharacterized protein LOC129907895 isoform X2 [Episyrphus balteatus]|uniref:uncharacterized protein LOC129907895 isoform X2 n=1 Tax=Episyrphus balteatus TaxID=286459 RepID=UPI0024856EAD|nr:uncharacterized protein LOC129907895 isoform X2 [Episyrphus balteatus]